MFSFQKYASDRTSLGYDLSSLNIAYSNTIVFVSAANNANSKNNDVKTVLASKNIDKGKSILGASPSLIRKRLDTLGLRRSSIFVITVKRLDILDLIAISG